jgi:hypothetical protein
MLPLEKLAKALDGEPESMLGRPCVFNLIGLGEVDCTTSDQMEHDVLAALDDKVLLELARLALGGPVVDGDRVSVRDRAGDCRALACAQAMRFGEGFEEVQGYFTVNHYFFEGAVGEGGVQANLLLGEVVGDFLPDVPGDYEAVGMTGDQIHSVNAQEIDQYGGIRHDDNCLPLPAHSLALLRTRSFS